MRKYIVLLIISLIFIVSCAPVEEPKDITKTKEPEIHQPLAKVGATKEIQITEEGFSPQELKIKKGESITWTNERPVPARIIGGESCPSINSPLLDQGESFQKVFEEAGECPIAVGLGHSGEECTDDNQCSNARSCLENQCNFISDLFLTSGCSQVCTIIRVKLSTYHKDYMDPASQDYILRMGLGSYTGAGALSWTIMPIPDFCKPGDAERIFEESNTLRAKIPIPFLIEEIDNNVPLGSRVVTIPTNEEKTLTHPTVDLHGFTIKVNDVHMTCGTESVFS